MEHEAAFRYLEKHSEISDVLLAGGDPLHFPFLLQGLPVRPAEWWDAHWIEDRLKRKLGAGLPFGTATVRADI